MHSMTGFARTVWQNQDSQWQAEIKAVNGRNLDLRLRVPEGMEWLDYKLRQTLPQHIKRGSLQLTISVQRQNPSPLQLQPEFFRYFQKLRQELATDIDCAPPKLEAVLAIPGMLGATTAATAPDESFWDTIWAGLIVVAVRQLNAMRQAEGKKLQQLCQQHLDSIKTHLATAESRQEPQSHAMQQRLQQQLAALGTAAIEPQRLAQELAMILVKIDVREELDRISAHIQAMEKLLQSPDPIGRNLDFLLQEFNREANTLCAKSADMPLTQAGLGLKNAIDQLREQAQNIE
jgi:uncharacterized protein (TIGR00255 family)